MGPYPGPGDLDFSLEGPLLNLNIGPMSRPRCTQNFKGNGLKWNLCKPRWPTVVNPRRQRSRFGLWFWPLLLLLLLSLFVSLPFVLFLHIVSGNVQTLTHHIEESGENVVHVRRRFSRRFTKCRYRSGKLSSVITVDPLIVRGRSWLIRERPHKCLVV